MSNEKLKSFSFHLQLISFTKATSCERLLFHDFSKTIRPRLFYLLDYITLSGIAKCGDQEKK